MSVLPRRRLVVASVCLLSASMTAVNGFSPSAAVSQVSINSKTSSSSSSPSSPSLSSTRLHVLPPDPTTDYADLLNHVTHTTNLLADAAVSARPDGWWGAYINLFETALKGVHSVVDPPLRSVGIEQTWGASIALFTFLARALLLPLSIQQSKSSEYMKVLKPYVTEIKAKFKNNQDAMNRAIGKLYEDANQNPLSGCLVSLAQIPIFLGLYRGIRFLALDGELDEPFFFIPSLQGPVSPPDFRGMDWLFSGWTNIDGQWTPPLGWENTLAFLALPVLLVVLQSTTMRVLQPPVDQDASEEERRQMETTQGVLKFLPLMLGFFSLQVPAGLCIYWLSSNIFTLSQSLGVRAYFAANPPKIKLPEYWDQISESKDFKDMTPEERRKAAEAGLSVGPSFEDLVAESKFHVLVERRPFRTETEAWRRISSDVDKIQIPAAMQEWVMSSISSSNLAGTEAETKEQANGAHAAVSSSSKDETIAAVEVADKVST